MFTLSFSGFDFAAGVFLLRSLVWVAATPQSALVLFSLVRTMRLPSYMLTVKRQGQNTFRLCRLGYQALKDVRRGRMRVPMTAGWPSSVSTGQKSKREASVG